MPSHGKVPFPHLWKTGVNRFLLSDSQYIQDRMPLSCQDPIQTISWSLFPAAVCIMLARFGFMDAPEISCAEPAFSFARGADERHVCRCGAENFRTLWRDLTQLCSIF